MSQLELLSMIYINIDNIDGTDKFVSAEYYANGRIRTCILNIDTGEEVVKEVARIENIADRGHFIVADNQSVIIYNNENEPRHLESGYRYKCSIKDVDIFVNPHNNYNADVKAINVVTGKIALSINVLSYGITMDGKQFHLLRHRGVMGRHLFIDGDGIVTVCNSI